MSLLIIILFPLCYNNHVLLLVIILFRRNNFQVSWNFIRIDPPRQMAKKDLKPMLRPSIFFPNNSLNHHQIILMNYLASTYCCTRNTPSKPNFRVFDLIFQVNNPLLFMFVFLNMHALSILFYLLLTYLSCNTNLPVLSGFSPPHPFLYLFHSQTPRWSSEVAVSIPGV